VGCAGRKKKKEVPLATSNPSSGKFWPADFYATNDLSSPPFHQLTSFGPQYDEVNQTAPHMRLGLEAWGEWLTATAGYQGYRFDHAPGIEPWFQAEWLGMPMMSNKFAVLEYIGDIPATRRFLQTWINLVDQRGSLFDFMLHNDYLTSMCGAGTFNMATLTNAGLVAVAPQFVVTYVENHDTVRPCFSLDPQVGIQANKVLAYAYILVSEGYPSVFYHDYYFSPNANTNANPCTFNTDNPNDGYVGSPLKPKIDRLISARKRFAAGSTTYLPQTTGSPQNVYVAKRNGGGPSNKPGCILVINRSNQNVNVTINAGWTSTNVVDL
jgi:alpha-amylase